LKLFENFVTVSSFLSLSTTLPPPLLVAFIAEPSVYT
jgi:hypothetical protein